MASEPDNLYPIDMPIEHGGVNHRGWSNQHEDHKQRWFTWCGFIYSKGHLHLRPGEKVTCMRCIVAPVPDALRGWDPPFESMG